MFTSPIFIAIAAFVAVSATVGALAMILRDKPASRVEDRLDMLTSLGNGSAKDTLKAGSVLSQPLDDSPGLLEKIIKRFGDIHILFEQADTSMTVPKLGLFCGGLGFGGAFVLAFTGLHPALLPFVGVFLGSLPVFWLFWRRKRRLKKFAAQLPDAMEMLSRALRAGQSLGYGFNSVAGEMLPPISKEFGRVFEEQNLGVTLEESLTSMAERVPNLDLKFFATAVILQRQTGGDLAEILDKIGELIRDRFRIWGQVQALTGEGRLSGIVLLALPFALFFAVYYLNPDYVMVLFTDPMGKQMLAAGIVMQILGAVVIRKIVNIKV
jgi:tight adherence protein B